MDHPVYADQSTRHIEFECCTHGAALKSAVLGLPQLKGEQSHGGLPGAEQTHNSKHTHVTSSLSQQPGERACL
jgi:hypothetical protein